MTPSVPEDANLRFSGRHAVFSVAGSSKPRVRRT